MTILFSSSTNYLNTANVLLWDQIKKTSLHKWDKITDSPACILEAFEMYGEPSKRYSINQGRFLRWSLTLPANYKEKIQGVVTKIFNPAYHFLLNDHEKQLSKEEFAQLPEKTKIDLVHIACTLGKTDFLRTHDGVIKHIVSYKNKFGEHTTILAACGQHYETIEYLLQANLSLISDLHSSGWHPVHLAAKLGDIKMLTLFVRSCPNLLTSTYYSDNFLPIHTAAMHGQIDFIDHALSLNENLLTAPTKKEGNQMIHLAAMHNHPELVKYLIHKNSALIHSINSNGLNTLQLTMNHSTPKMLEQLLRLYIELCWDNYIAFRFTVNVCEETFKKIVDAYRSILENLQSNVPTTFERTRSMLAFIRYYIDCEGKLRESQKENGQLTEERLLKEEELLKEKEQLSVEEYNHPNYLLFTTVNPIGLVSKVLNEIECLLPNDNAESAPADLLDDQLNLLEEIKDGLVMLKNWQELKDTARQTHQSRIVRIAQQTQITTLIERTDERRKELIFWRSLRQMDSQLQN